MVKTNYKQAKSLNKGLLPVKPVQQLTLIRNWISTRYVFLTSFISDVFFLNSSGDNSINHWIIMKNGYSLWGWYISIPLYISIVKAIYHF